MGELLAWIFVACLVEDGSFRLRLETDDEYVVFIFLERWDVFFVFTAERWLICEGFRRLLEAIRSAVLFHTSFGKRLTELWTAVELLYHMVMADWAAGD